jgi:hypothetical protein
MTGKGLGALQSHYLGAKGSAPSEAQVTYAQCLVQKVNWVTHYRKAAIVA